MTQEMSSRRGWRALGPTNIRLRWSREGVESPTNIRLRWSREGIESPTNIRLRWSREGIETILRTFGSAGAGRGSRVLQTFGSAGAGKGSRRSYKHSAPLEPGRDREGPTNIRSAGAGKGSRALDATLRRARLQRSGKLSRPSRDEEARPLRHPALKYRARVTPPL